MGQFDAVSKNRLRALGKRSKVRLYGDAMTPVIGVVNVLKREKKLSRQIGNSAKRSSAKLVAELKAAPAGNWVTVRVSRVSASARALKNLKGKSDRGAVVLGPRHVAKQTRTVTAINAPITNSDWRSEGYDSLAEINSAFGFKSS